MSARDPRTLALLAALLLPGPAAAQGFAGLSGPAAGFAPVTAPAALGVLLPMRNPETSAWTAILICAYPVIETVASMWRKSRRAGHSAGQPDRVHFHMLAHRRYARRLVKRQTARHLRNPATSLVTWLLPLLTAGFAAIAYDTAAGSAFLFFVTAVLYGFLYRLMSLNGPRLPAAITRLL